MSTSPTTKSERTPLRPLDNETASVLADLYAHVNARFDELAARLATVERSSFAGQVEDRLAVLKALQSACDDASARLQWFISMGREATDLLNQLKEDAAPVGGVVPNVGEAIATAVAGAGGAAKKKDEGEDIGATINRLLAGMKG